MSHTKKNLLDVEDAAARFGYAQAQESRFPGADLGARRTGIAHHVLRPGKRQPFGHRHAEAEEVAVVLRGGGRVRLGDDLLELHERDAVRIAPEVPRRFEAGPDGMEMLVFGPRHDGDAELLPDFWAPD